MQNLLSNLTAALLALHTVFGCCGHHAHGDTPECASSASVESSEGCVAGHDGGPCAAAAGNHEHHGGHDCQGAKCVFVSAANCGSHPSSIRADLPSNAALPITAPGVVVRQKSFFAPDDLLPPLRLHLVERVLLI